MMDRIRTDLALLHDKKESILLKVANGAKFIGIFATSLLLGVAVILLCPLRMLHPVLRKLGMRNGDLPVDVIARLYANAIVTLVGIDINIEGLDHIEASRDLAEDGAVCMFSHASNLDPFIIAAAQPLACKWVGKKASHPNTTESQFDGSAYMSVRISSWFP